MLIKIPNEDGLHVTARQISQPLRDALLRKPITERFPDGTILTTEILANGVVSLKIINKGPAVLRVIEPTQFWGQTIVLDLEGNDE